MHYGFQNNVSNACLRTIHNKFEIQGFYNGLMLKDFRFFSIFLYILALVVLPMVAALLSI